MSYESALNYVKERFTKPSVDNALTRILVPAVHGVEYGGSPISTLFDLWMNYIYDPMAKVMADGMDKEILKRFPHLGLDFDGDASDVLTFDLDILRRVHTRLDTPYCKDIMTAREWLEHETSCKEDARWRLAATESNAMKPIREKNEQIRLYAEQEQIREAVNDAVNSMKEVNYVNA